jgi:hypothetical protein
MTGRSDPWPDPILKKFLANVGIAGSNTLVSGTLAENFVEEAVSLNRDEFALQFEIVRS